MRLSKILKEKLPEYECTFINEKEFDTLGLVGSNTGSEKKCTFVDNEAYIESIGNDVSVLITTADIATKIDKPNLSLCITDKPRIVYFKLHNVLSSEKGYAREKKKTVIGKNCKIHPSAVIASDNVIIGDNTIIEEYVVIRENVKIGDNCIFRSGVKIGCPDFEFKRDGNEMFAVIHCGGVVIGDDVEVLPNTGINAALYPWDDTIVGNSCKIDMLCNISHGAKIGDRTMIVALSGIGGRTEVGSDSWIGYGSIIRNGIVIGNNARTNMGAIVTKSVADGESVTGNFAIRHDLFMNNLKQTVKKSHCEEKHNE